MCKPMNPQSHVFPELDIRDPEAMGKVAFLDGLQLSDNPYHYLCERELWAKGWKYQLVWSR